MAVKGCGDLGGHVMGCEFRYGDVIPERGGERDEVAPRLTAEVGQTGDERAPAAGQAVRRRVALVGQAGGALPIGK